MTTEAAAAPAAAPTPAPEAQPAPAAKPSFNSPFIPPLRTRPGDVRDPARDEAPPEAKPEPTQAAPDPATEPKVEAEAPKGDPSQVEYDSNDIFEVTIDGKKAEVTLAKLIASYQRNEAANERFAQAKELQRGARAVMERMFTPDGFVEVFRHANVDPYEFAADLLLSRANYERMSPAERELHDLRQREQAWKREQGDRARAEAEAKAGEATRTFQTRFVEQATATMDAVGVPADPSLRAELMSRAAARARADLMAGYEATPAESMRDAWDDYRAALEAHARVIPVDRKLTPEERAAIAKQGAQERVRVAEQAPKVLPPRDDSGRFAAPRKPRMDMFNPMPRTR